MNSEVMTEKRVGFKLWRAANAWQRTVNHGLHSIGLTHVQFILLDGIAKMGDLDDIEDIAGRAPISQALLSRVVGTDEMMTSQVVRALEAKGLLDRRPSKNDLRVKLVSLTERGVAQYQLARDIVDSVEDELFTPMGGDIELFTAGLDRL